MPRLTSSFNRYVLPGLAFKAVVIGGGYATGRELVEFFLLPSGPWGGLLGLLVAMLCWSAMCAGTFLFAFRLKAYDYSSFFRALLGRFDVAFEIVYFADLILILSVFGSAAGAIGTAVLGVPPAVGTLSLIGAILFVCTVGQAAAEVLFKYVSFLLYGVFAVFLLLCLFHFGDGIARGFEAKAPVTGWVEGGVTYASYNVIGAVLILPVLRHLRGDREAVIAGLLAGPLAIVPAAMFFVALVGFYPTVVGSPLPSDMVLSAIGLPWFHALYQAMVFFALLESSVGFVQAFSARLDAYYEQRNRKSPTPVRFGMMAAILFGAIYLASEIGIIDLISRGYRLMAYCILAIYVGPLVIVGASRLRRRCVRWHHDRLARRSGG